MQKKFTFVTCLVLSLIGLSALAVQKELTILHTNDIHGHALESKKYGSMGLAKISYYSKQLKKQGKHVLLMNAGDAVTGTPLSEFFKGISIYDIMSKAGYDVATLGNHEFDLGWKHIAEYKKAANFPIVCCNAMAPNGDLIAEKPFLIKNINGLKVGIIGLVTKHTKQFVVKNRNKGIKFTDELKAMRNILPELRAKCDIIVLLTHSGYDEDVEIANAAKGVDLVIGGHSHTDLQTPTISATGARVLQAYSYTRVFGEINLTYDTEKKKIIRFAWNRVTGDKIKGQDKATADLLKKWQNKISKTFYDPIGAPKREYSVYEFKLIIEKYLKSCYKTDLAYMNARGVRSKLLMPNISERDMWIAMPFDNYVTVVKMRGNQIKGAFKEQLEESGVRINPKKVYSVATNDFVSGNAKTELGGKIISEKRTPLTIRDFMIQQIKKHSPIKL